MNYLYAGVGIVVTSVASPIIFLLSLQCVRSYKVPAGIPWAGLQDKKIFPKLRACFREFTAGRAPLQEGYEKYSKHGKPFVAPAFHWPEVILPPSNLAWLVAQPENVLSAGKVQEDAIGLSYISHGPDLAAIIDFTVVRRDLTRNLSKVLPGVLDEIELCFDEKLQDITDEWTDCRLFETIREASRQLNNRIFVGLPLCRDKRYINGLQIWESAFGFGGGIIRYLIPQPLRPWLAPIIALPAQIQSWRLKRLILPIMRARIDSQKAAVDSKSTEESPTDVLQWLMDDKNEKSPSRGMTLSDMAGKTIELNFFSVATVEINTASALTDILCYSSASTLIAELREEADAVLPRLKSDPRAIRDMVKLDSVIRESLRLNTMAGRGLSREVVAPQGVTTPDGLYLPCGTCISMGVSSRQHDADVWERADEFVPLRFIRSEDTSQVDEPKKKQAKHAVHVSEDFLSFGYGRHSCPGRFFAVQALKVLIGHLLINYDFEPCTERPKSVEIGEAIVPSDKTIVKMRRRQ